MTKAAISCRTHSAAGFGSQSAAIVQDASDEAIHTLSRLKDHFQDRRNRSQDQLDRFCDPQEFVGGLHTPFKIPEVLYEVSLVMCGN